MSNKKHRYARKHLSKGSMYPNKMAFFNDMAHIEKRMLKQQAIEDEVDRAAGRENMRCPICGGRRAMDGLRHVCQWCGCKDVANLPSTTEPSHAAFNTHHARKDEQA